MPLSRQELQRFLVLCAALQPRRSHILRDLRGRLHRRKQRGDGTVDRGPPPCGILPVPAAARSRLALLEENLDGGRRGSVLERGAGGQCDGGAGVPARGCVATVGLGGGVREQERVDVARAGTGSERCGV